MKITTLLGCSAVLLAILFSGCSSGDGEECTPNDRTFCQDGVSSWLDSCGNETSVEETCECGCNADSTGCKEPCECVPDCGARECGPDPLCQTSCGDCPAEQVCDDGSCVIPCTDDETRCEGDVVETCGDNEWSAGVDCSEDNQVCVDGACVYPCTDGEARCEGTTIVTCNANRWVPGVNCAGRAQVCMDGGCVTPCTDGEIRCADDVVETCNTNRWIAGLDCAESWQICLDGACVVDCIDGETRCGGNVIYTCSSDTWLSGLDCYDTGLFCMGGECSESMPCHTWADCPRDATCTIGVNDELTELFGECATYGALAPGAACNESDDPAELSFEERCSAMYCFGGMCTEVCVVNSDCPDGMLCEEIQLSSVDDSIDVCIVDKLCAAPADCQEGESCWPQQDHNHLIGWCHANAGQDPVGSECDPDADSCEVFCIEPFCTEWCGSDEDCPAGLICDVLNFCLAEPCSDFDNLAAASLCVQDARCDGPADCEEGSACWPTLTGDNMMVGRCRANEGEDQLGTACSSADDTCQTFCYEALCTEWCSLNEDCPIGMICEVRNFCLVEPCSDPNNWVPASICA